MGKREDRVYQQNAKRGAVTRWCPRCKRLAALSAIRGHVTLLAPGRVSGRLYRQCRYCGLQVKSGGKYGAARRRYYAVWRRQQEQRNT